MFLLMLIVLFVVFIVMPNVRIVPQTKAYVIERLGAYHSTWSTGLHFKIPFIDRVALKADLKEQVIDFPPQPVITQDNVTMNIDTVVFYQVTDSKLFAYGVEDPLRAIENLTATTLRNICGEMDLDKSLTSRTSINDKIRVELDEATDAWGIKVNRVEVKNIDPPAGIKEVMEKQMKAERDKRATILDAEASKESAILVATGDKEAKILEADAEKQAAVLRAEGEAKAIELVQNATAEGLKKISESKPSDAALTLKSLESVKDLANGTATKIVVPSNLQGLAGLAVTAEELFKK